MTYGTWKVTIEEEGATIQVGDKDPLRISLDHDSFSYQVSKRDEDNEWLLVSTIVGNHTQANLTCPACQCSTVFPDARAESSYECDHCGLEFSISK